MHDLASAGVLVGARTDCSGARCGPQVTVAPAGDAPIGRVYHMMEWPGGGVLGREGMVFARAAGGNARLRPRAVDTGPVLAARFRPGTAHPRDGDCS